MSGPAADGSPGPGPRSGAPVEGLRLTAAICTRDRPDTLRRALDSLLEQEPSPAEIVVVDNGSHGPGVEAALSRLYPGVRWVREPIEGLNFARNRALRAATGEVVAFLDDDAVAKPGWAAAIAAVFREDPALAVCTGRVLPLSLEEPGAELFEANGGFARGEARIRLPVEPGRTLHRLPAPRIAWAVSVGSGVSYAVRRRVALELGGFDEALDMGGVLPGGGDHDLLWRALDAGHRVLYEPAAVALHEHRSSVSEACDQIVGHQRGLVAMLTKAAWEARGLERVPVLAFLVWRLLKPGIRLLRRAVGRDPLPARTLFRMWGACWGALGAYREGRRIADTRRRAVRSGA